MQAWSIDLGTTNTALARWDEERGRPVMIELPGVSREVAPDDPLEVPRGIPSATQMLPADDLLSRLGSNRLVSRFALLGRMAVIGRPALEANSAAPSPAFVRSFKPLLAEAPLQTVARVGRRRFTAREVTRAFVRELMGEVKRSTGDMLRRITVTAPVESFESYRAEVAAALRAAGVREVHFADEPVAAALGYGLSLDRERIVLVVDFGGGTLDFALVRMSARSMQLGQCEVLAKTGRPLGGNDVDAWLVEAIAERIGFPLRGEEATEDERFWHQLLLVEASRVKEALFLRPSETFVMVPPEDLRLFEARLRGDASAVDVTRTELVGLLQQRGLYASLAECMEEIERDMARLGLADADIGDVLMVGGSTLLPDVYGVFEQRFGRSRVRAFQPFEAVAYGACVLSAGAMQTSDFIVHDYGLVTHDLQTHKPRYEIVVPRGTRFPTPGDVWRRRVVPTCSMGVPEDVFKLVVAEIGRGGHAQRRFAWSASGELHALRSEGATGNAESSPIVVPLNEQNPALGVLKPPHLPGDTSARLEIAFGVNADRWLVATVRDLKTDRVLMNQQPVVQLL